MMDNKLKAHIFIISCYLVSVSPSLLALDMDGDGLSDNSDNCIYVPNPINRDSDNDGFGNYCDPDFDGNMSVNAADLAYLKSKFFTNDPHADLNGDGLVNAGDLSVLKSFFFKPPGPSGAVQVSDIQILMPTNGATVDDSTVNVYGTFLGDAASGVLVNGKQACTKDNAFYINNVDLVDGINQISVVLTQSDGTKSSQAVQVTGATSNNVDVTTSGACGAAPLDVFFDVNVKNITLQRFDIDYDGDGASDYFASIFPDVPLLSNTYTASGVYEPEIIITDTDGQIYKQKIYLVLKDEVEQDLLFQQIWTNMTAALSVSDRDAALTYFSSDSRNLYGAIFEAILPNITEILADWSSIEPIYFDTNTADYAILSVVNGQVKSFIIQFKKDGDGIWRIDSL